MINLKQAAILAALCCVGLGEAAAHTPQSAIPKKIPARYDSDFFRTLQSETLTSREDVKWRNFGPAMAGYCDEFWVHPTNPDFMYTTLDMGNCYYTDNNGDSWVTTHDWDLTGESCRIGWIDFSHQEPTFGLAIDDKGGLMQTFNQGRRFEPITSSKGYPQRVGNGKKSVIAVDPSNDNNWYIGAGQGWRVKNTRFSLKNPHGTKYRNTDYGYILVSKDRGASWREVRVGFDDLDVFKIYVNPADGREVYAFTNNGFYKSSNGGDSFKRKGKGLPFNIARDGAMHYDAKSGKVTLFQLEQTHYTNNSGEITSEGGLFRSDDLGETWRSVTGDMALDYSVFQKNYFILTQFQKTMSHWFGTNMAQGKVLYKTLPKNLLSSYNRVIVNPLNVNEICVSNNITHDISFGPVEMWKSDDGGEHWYPTMRNGSYWGDESDKEFWLSRGDGKDALGRNMTFAHLESEAAAHPIWAGCRYATYNTRGEIIVVMEQQVLRSVDGGASFQQIDDIESTPGSWVGKGCSNLPGEGLEHETGMRSPMLRSGEHGLWALGDMGDCKYDGVAVKQLSGQSKSTSDARSISAVAVDPTDTTKIYTLMFRQNHRGYVRASKDSGETWYTVNPDQPAVDYDKRSQEHCHQKDLRIDPKNTKRMYFTIPVIRYDNHTLTQWRDNLPKGFGKEKAGVMRSDDGGFTWSLANKGISAASSIWRLEMDPFDSKTLYACSTGEFENGTINGSRKVVGGALYKSTNGGDSWSKMRIPSEIECVNHLFVDRNTGELYLSAGQANGSVEAGGVWCSKDGKRWTKLFEMPYIKECYTSNVNPNIITVSVGQCRQVKHLNAGAYLSEDGGSSWSKINYMLGQPGRVNALRPDQYDASVIWAALYGSGWYKAVIPAK